MSKQLNNNGCTLIIPVRERQHNLKRVIEFFKDYKYEKIIIDSSREKYSCDDFKGFEYRYFGPILYYEKVAQTAESIESKYCILSDDGDFTIQESIYECVEFLENNPDYVQAEGQTGNFFKNGMFVNNNNTTDKPDMIYSNRLNKNFFSDDNVLQRIQNNLNKDFQAPNHAVMKTEVTRDAYRLAADNKEIRPIRYFDKILALVSGCYGNSKMLPILHNVKEIGDSLIHNPKIQKLLEDDLQINMGIQTICCKEKCFPIAKYISKFINNDIDSILNFTINLFKTYGQNELGYTDKIEIEMPLFDKKFDKQKQQIRELLIQ